MATTKKNHETTGRAELPVERPAGALRVAWIPNPATYAADPQYRATIDDVLAAYFPGRCASPSTLELVVDDAGHQQLAAACTYDKAGDWNRDHTGRHAPRVDLVPYDGRVQLP